jgi:hypothetical protein
VDTGRRILSASHLESSSTSTGKVRVLEKSASSVKNANSLDDGCFTDRSPQYSKRRGLSFSILLTSSRRSLVYHSLGRNDSCPPHLSDIKIKSAHMALTTFNQPSFRFLDLPVELRRSVYENIVFPTTWHVRDRTQAFMNKRN